MHEAQRDGIPWLSHGLPGSGGRIKERPEDFEVEEVPAYLPSGEGTHLYLWIEKIEIETQAVARALAKAAGVDVGEVGYAGMKDRRAVTRQLFSVPARAEAALASFALPGVRVLWTRRHGNKLRTGHLIGNRFRLRIRGAVDPDAGLASFDVLTRRGLPNAFGAQRFGARGDNAALGKLLLQGEWLPTRPDRFQRKLYLSAYQSALFNRVLVQRLMDGTFDRALLGDRLRKETGGMFLCEAPEVDQPRVDAFELSATGPLFGPKMPRPAGEVDAREQALLAEEGLALSDFKRGGGETEGARRALRVRLGDPSAARDGDDLLLAFTLPAGSYATQVLDEVVKPEGDRAG